MSTRSLIVLGRQLDWCDDEAKEVARIYRHCDGYPSGAGKCLAEAMKATGDELNLEETKKKLKWEGEYGPITVWPSIFMRHLLMPREDGWSDIRTYQFEPSDTEHGDIEWLYQVTAPYWDNKHQKQVGPVLRIWHVDGFDHTVREIIKQKPYFHGTAETFLEMLKEWKDE